MGPGEARSAPAFMGGMPPSFSTVIELDISVNGGIFGMLHSTRWVLRSRIFIGMMILASTPAASFAGVVHYQITASPVIECTPLACSGLYDWLETDVFRLDVGLSDDPRGIPTWSMEYLSLRRNGELILSAPPDPDYTLAGGGRESTGGLTVSDPANNRSLDGPRFEIFSDESFELLNYIRVFMVDDGGDRYSGNQRALPTDMTVFDGFRMELALQGRGNPDAGTEILQVTSIQVVPAPGTAAVFSTVALAFGRRRSR